MSGYNPALTNTSQLPQSLITFYDAKFIENLKLNTLFLMASEARPLPMYSGNKLELFMYQPFGANTSQVSEGTVGSGIVPTVLTNTSTIGQYADYISLSDLARDTALDNGALSSLRDEIAYRAALSLNTVHRNVVDQGFLIDSSVNALNKAFNATITKQDFVNAIQSLQGRAVQPFDSATGQFVCLIHPFQVGDALNDTASGGITDIAKFGGVTGSETHSELYELPGPEAETINVLNVSGGRFYPCQMVTQTANYLGHTGVTAFRSYYFGKNSTFRISLMEKEGAKIGDGQWRNIDVVLQKNPGTSAADPAGVIGGWTSYNLKYTASLGPDTTLRYRTIDAPSNVS